MSVPQLINNPYFSQICSTGWRPLLLTGFLLEWMRAHFALAESIEDEDLTNTLWKADNTTNILIESITRWQPELTGARPAIIVKRNDIQNQRLGIDDRLMGGVGIETDDFYSTYLLGSHTLFCLAKDGAEAEKLSTETYRELIEFSKVFRAILDFHRLKLQGIGSLFRIEEDRETFAVPVTIEYAFEENWKIVPRAPLLKTIDLAVLQP